MIIDEHKYNIVNKEDGSITAVPNPFIPNSKDIQEYWDSIVFDKRQELLSDIEYLYKVKCYTDDKNIPTTGWALRYDEKKGIVEPVITFSEEQPFCFNSEESVNEAIAIVGQEKLLTLYKR